MIDAAIRKTTGIRSAVLRYAFLRSALLLEWTEPSKLGKEGVRRRERA